ncbi:hypothetical protein [Roseobacter sp.]|uniref:hypothetical protein n=1 Tax=Roseobacter sp. TaxID=1907202 RepID=UPI0029662E2D|nr:hypothetical protein [Roseobacter sp.]MDW3182266.1 hypothetical protein [Roseobacter sp.]
MTNSSKILTVSYGTFSCTLEGFDDSFDTMKAIAEYFRDLASDDRYFGAEPPQPDAEMLARIAEREVARRVEAREQDGRILLKAQDETVQPEEDDAAAALDVEDVSEPENVQEPLSDVETVDAETSDTEAVSEVTEAELETDQETTPVIEEGAAQAAQEDDEPDVAEVEAALEPEVAEVAASDDIADVAPVEAAAPEEEEPADVDVVTEDSAETEELPEQEAVLNAEAFFANSPAPSDIDPEMEAEMTTSSEFSAFEPVASFEPPQAASEAAAETIAAKLQRIREVVSQQEDEAPAEEETATSEGSIDILDMPFDLAIQPSEEATEEADETNETLTAAAQDIAEAFDADDQIAAEAAETPEEEDDLSAVLSRLEADEHDSTDSLLGTDETEVDAQDAAENLFGDVAEDQEDAPAAAHDAEEVEADQPETREVKGRVLKVDRADLEAALESGDLEEFDGDDAILSDQHEAARQHELDAVTAENDQAEKETSTARDALPAIDSGMSEDVSRLMAEADHQMEEPEGATRRSAFAHLRAAVAARFADTSMAKEETEEETTKAYRSDLAQVVKPRRPVASGSRTERPAEPRPAPLKLVAEQRIDESAANADPVTPRRVAATLEDDPAFAEDTGFAEFAEQMGATKLPEVLEAAAAYLCFVEGHDQFSRPQLMTRVRQAECGDFSREDGLRSFGQLLRSGKIEKIKGGRFAASDAIGFKPDERVAS